MSVQLRSLVKESLRYATAVVPTPQAGRESGIRADLIHVAIAAPPSRERPPIGARILTRAAFHIPTHRPNIFRLRSSDTTSCMRWATAVEAGRTPPASPHRFGRRDGVGASIERIDTSARPG